MKEAADMRRRSRRWVRGAVPSDAGPPRNTEISHLYKSGDTYDNFLRLVRLTGPC
jgi:hypothetical protein